MNHRDFAIVNANVYTVDATDSTAQAIFIRDGKIAAVGSDAHIRAIAGSHTELLDAGGRTVTPGFIDAHNHLSIAAFSPEYIDLSAAVDASMSDVMSVIANHVQALPPGQWVIAWNFYAPHVREQRNPTRWELDEASPDNPIFVVDLSCHMGIANSLALAEAGISTHSPQPGGGEIEKDHRGEPTGVLYETASNPLHSLSWNSYARRDWDRAVGMLEAKMGQYLASGLTGVGDAMVTATSAELYRRADAAGRLPFTVQQLHGGDHFFARQDLRRADLIDRIKQSDTDRLRGGAIKVFVDPAYPDGPAIDRLHDGCTQHVGSAFYEKHEVAEIATRASDLEITTAIHAMGNCSVDTVLDAYESVRLRSGSDAVLRLEHAFVADPAQGARMADLGVDLVANPGLGFHVGPHFDMWRGKGQEHLRVLPVRSMLEAGVRVSLASDHPCGTFAPLEIMGIAATRMVAGGGQFDPEEAITGAQGLRGFTINPAHASGRANEEGSIEVGKRANLVVLDRNIVECPVEEISTATVDMTFVDGKLMHSRDR